MTLYPRDDWTLFRNLETLGQKAGVSVDNLARLIAKELADNALDATDSSDVGLNDTGGFYVADDGPGLPESDPQDIARLFSIARPLVSSKLLRKPSRGCLGNGLRVVAGAVLATGGTLRVATRGCEFQLTPLDDGTTQVDIIGTTDRPGTRVDVSLGPPLVVNTNTLDWAQRACTLAKGGENYKGKPSPHWYDAASFFEFLQANHNRPVREAMAAFDGCTGAKAGQIAQAFRGRFAPSLSRDEAAILLDTARRVAKPVNPDRLGKVGPHPDLPAAYAVTTGTFTLRAARGQHQVEIPCVVEAWVGLESQAHDASYVQILAHVNKTPATTEMQGFHDRKDRTLYIVGAGLKSPIEIGRAAPRTVWLNIQTPYIPLTSDGKAPDLSVVENHIITVIQKATRKARSTYPRQQGQRKRTIKESILAHLDAVLATVSSGGHYRFSQRQVFYGIRPLVADEMGQQVQYDYFTGVLTDYETTHGPIKGLYRDPRGTLYHPHLHEDISLGTLAVEQYRRPAWTFNKILYCEKEGFFAVLKDEKWPERHDCALLTSKGQASRATKDLLDLLGDTDEELTFYCIHDADAAGTVIYQSLQEATRTRPGRRVRVINLGLEPWEAVQARMEVETVSYETRQPVAGYVAKPDEPHDEDWATWLQTHRVELNAMTTEEFLRWLDTKMARFGNGKVIPPTSVLTTHLRGAIRTVVDEHITAQILVNAQKNGRVDAACRTTEEVIERIGSDLRGSVTTALEQTPVEAWKAPIERMAQDIAMQTLADSA